MKTWRCKWTSSKRQKGKRDKYLKGNKVCERLEKKVGKLQTAWKSAYKGRIKPERNKDSSSSCWRALEFVAHTLPVSEIIWSEENISNLLDVFWHVLEQLRTQQEIKADIIVFLIADNTIIFFFNLTGNSFILQNYELIIVYLFFNFIPVISHLFFLYSLV